MGAKYDQLDLDERIEMSRLYEAAGFTDQVQHLRFSRKASAGVLKPSDFLGVELMAQVRSSMSRAV